MRGWRPAVLRPEPGNPCKRADGHFDKVADHSVRFVEAWDDELAPEIRRAVAEGDDFGPGPWRENSDSVVARPGPE